VACIGLLRIFTVYIHHNSQSMTGYMSTTAHIIITFVKHWIPSCYNENQKSFLVLAHPYIPEN